MRSVSILLYTKGGGEVNLHVAENILAQKYQVMFS